MKNQLLFSNKEKILLHFPHLKNKLSTSLPAFKLK